MIDIPEIRRVWFLEQLEALKEQGITNKKVAEKLDLKPQYLNSIKSGKRSATESIVFRFCEEFGINHNDLLDRLKRYEIEDNHTDKLFSESSQDYSERKKIPLYDAETIGGINDRRADVNIPHSQIIEWVDAGDWFPDATAAIRHYGDSMPEYPSGSILVLRRVLDHRLIIWGRNYSIETTEFRITKRLQDGDENHILAYSSNKEAYPDGKQIHEPIKIPKDSIRHIDLVLGCVTLEYSSSTIPIYKIEK